MNPKIPEAKLLIFTEKIVLGGWVLFVIAFIATSLVGVPDTGFSGLLFGALNTLQFIILAVGWVVVKLVIIKSAKKATPKSKKTKTPKLNVFRQFVTLSPGNKIWAVILIGLFYFLPGIIIYEDVHLAYDKIKFASVEKDFKKFETQFNKVDPGWQLNNNCVGVGVFEEIFSCRVILGNDKINGEYKEVANKYLPIVEQTKGFAIKSTKESAYEGVQTYTFSLSRPFFNDCSLSFSEKLDSRVIQAAIVCLSDSEYEHYPELPYRHEVDSKKSE